MKRAPAAYLILIAVLATCAAGCGGRGSASKPLAGEPTIRYSAQTMRADSSSHISLETHRIYRGTASGEGLLYTPIYLDVDGEGNVYVADNGNKNIVVFSADGEYRRTLGREGQGPGEINQARGIAVTGGLVYALVDWNRVNVWDTLGNHVRDVRLPSSKSFHQLSALEDGTLVTYYNVSPSGPPSGDGPFYDDWVLNGYADDGGPELVLSREYAVRPFIAPYRIPPVDYPRPIYAVGRNGRVYVSDAATYDVVAFAATGELLWALSADVDAPPVLESDIEHAMGSARPGFEFTRDAYVWPEHFPTLFFMRVDGHGHLYVYRWMRRYSDSAVFPVDVFSENGEHLFSGTIDRKQWLVGNGDLVYGFDDDDESGGRVVVAYRLVEPF